MKKIWDISPCVDSTSPVFPGDTPYQQQWSAQWSEQCPVNVSAISLSPHVGAHADAPLHYSPQGHSIGQVDLAPYLGPCRVVHCALGLACVKWQDIAHAITQDLPPRLLLRTYAAQPRLKFDTQLPAIAPDVLNRLADMGLLLIGTDSASIDPAESQTLPSHQVLRLRNLRVLENLLLDAVPAGDYELIALPLKLAQADASPVRAILREL